MARSVQQIVALYRQRKNDLGPVRARAAELAQVYDGLVTVPIPELDESQAPAIANWLTQGLDQLAMRIASVMPAVTCPPLKLGFKGSEDNARTRRRALTAWWQENQIDLQLSKRARWLVGYASSPCIIRPDTERGIPTWEPRDPLSCYPAPHHNPVNTKPRDCIFAVSRTWQWISDHYPRAARSLDAASSPNPDRLFECLEYWDAEECVLVALGTSTPAPSRPYSNLSTNQPSQLGLPYVELERTPNKVGRCPVVIPWRISLNEPRGQFDAMPTLYKMQARVFALWLVATQRQVFPDTWFVSRPNETVSILQTPDGRTGQVGQVKGGDLREVSAASPPQVAQVIQMLERNMMTTASVPGDFGGEPNSAVRTGRAQENSMKQTVDYWVQEAQRAFGYALREENKLAIATARAYFGERPCSFYVSFAKTKGFANYIPDKDFDTDANVVEWPFAGADAEGMTVGIGQRLGTGEISKRTARVLDPWIDDPDLEEDRVLAESLDQAMQMAISQAIINGQIGPLEVGQLRQMVREERVDIYEAYDKLHQKVQAQQAAAQAAQQGPPGPAMGGGPPGAGGPPGPGGPPGAGGPPGLAAPAIAAQLGLPAAGNAPGGGETAPAPSIGHMASLMSALRPRSIGGPGQ